MSIGEITRYIEGYHFRKEAEQRERASFDYALAVLIGTTTVGQLSKNNKVPTIEEVYPSLFRDNEAYQERVEAQKADASIARFLQFANAHNAKINSEDIKDNESRNLECEN